MDIAGAMGVDELTRAVTELNKRVMLLELRYVPKTKVFALWYDSNSTWSQKTLLGIYSTSEIAETKIDVHAGFNKSQKDWYQIEEMMIDEF
jgi:hypothetical protein